MLRTSRFFFGFSSGDTGFFTAAFLGCRAVFRALVGFFEVIVASIFSLLLASFAFVKNGAEDKNEIVDGIGAFFFLAYVAIDIIYFYVCFLLWNIERMTKRIVGAHKLKIQKEREKGSNGYFFSEVHKIVPADRPLPQFRVYQYFIVFTIISIIELQNSLLWSLGKASATNQMLTRTYLGASPNIIAKFSIRHCTILHIRVSTVLERSKKSRKTEILTCLLE